MQNYLNIRTHAGTHTRTHAHTHKHNDNNYFAYKSEEFVLASLSVIDVKQKYYYNNFVVAKGQKVFFKQAALSF